MTMPTIYDLGDLVNLTGNFFSDPALTIPADPTAVVLSIRDPNRVVTTPSPTHGSTGVYTYAWTPTIPGLYEVNWTGTGTVVSADQATVLVKVGISLGQRYIALEQMKTTLSASSTTFIDQDLSLAIGAASRAVDTMCGRRFWLDADATKVRLYTPDSCRGPLQIDDLVVLGSVTIDRAGTGIFTETWTVGTDFVLDPANAPAEQPARPYEQLRVRRNSGQSWPERVEQSVKVTGQFGWASVPDDVTAATGIIASRLLKRGREAPFGVAMVGGIDGAAVRIARTDPDVYTLLRNYDRTVILV